MCSVQLYKRYMDSRKTDMVTLPYTQVSVSGGEGVIVDHKLIVYKKKKSFSKIVTSLVISWYAYVLISLEESWLVLSQQPHFPVSKLLSHQNVQNPANVQYYTGSNR